VSDNTDPISVLHKHPKKKGYTQVENSTIRDPRLSLKATGLLVYLISLKQGSPIGSRVIAKRKPEGRAAIMSAFKELRDLGYVDQSSVRKADGTFTTVTHVYEVPPGSETAPGFGQPGSGYPGSENRPTSLSESKTNDEDKGSFFVCPECADVFRGFDLYTDHRAVCRDEDFTPADRIALIDEDAA